MFYCCFCELAHTHSNSASLVLYTSTYIQTTTKRVWLILWASTYKLWPNVSGWFCELQHTYSAQVCLTDCKLYKLRLILSGWFCELAHTKSGPIWRILSASTCKLRSMCAWLTVSKHIQTMALRVWLILWGCTYTLRPCVPDWISD